MKEKIKKYFKSAYNIYYAIIMSLGILIIDTILIGGPLALIVYFFFLRQPCNV